MSEENKVTKFDHEVFGALDVVIMSDKPMFIASKVAQVLGYAKPNNAIKTHCKSMILLNAPFQGIEMPPKGINIIPEKDVYRLVMRSKLPNAEVFQDWVMETVLPTIRKESMYIVDEEKVSSGEMSEDELVLKAMTLMQTKIERLRHDKEVAEAESSRLQTVCATITDQFINAGQTPPKFCRKLNGVNINQVQNYMVEKKLLLPKSDSGWSPTSYARDKYLTEKTSVHFGLSISTSILTKAGAKWLYKKYLKKELPMKVTWNGELSSEVFED